MVVMCAGAGVGLVIYQYQYERTCTCSLEGTARGMHGCLSRRYPGSHSHAGLDDMYAEISSHLGSVRVVKPSQVKSSNCMFFFVF